MPSVVPVGLLTATPPSLMSCLLLDAPPSMLTSSPIFVDEKLLHQFVDYCGTGGLSMISLGKAGDNDVMRTNAAKNFVFVSFFADVVGIIDPVKEVAGYRPLDRRAQIYLAV